MVVSKPRKADTVRQIAQALHYLQGEAKAAALEHVAVAIGDAERSVRLFWQSHSAPGTELPRSPDDLDPDPIMARERPTGKA